MAAEPKKLLIVEDSPLILERLLRFLEGITELRVVGVSTTALDAQHRIDSDKPDLILLDIALEQGDGFQVIEGLRGRSGAPEVVMFTNFANPLFRQRAASWGVHNFFDKSTEFERALRCLKELAAAQSE